MRAGAAPACAGPAGAEPVCADPAGAEPVCTEPVRAVAASVAPAPVIRGDEWPDDSIPDLDDFDALPPSAESVPHSRRDEINAAVPMHQTKPSVRLWLQSLEERLVACESRQAVEAIALSNDVCRAGKALQGNARDQLRQILNTALARHELHANG